MFRMIACTCMVVMLGCGGGRITEEDREEARQVLGQYGRAFAAQDGEAGCRLLTEEMRARYGRRRGESCPTAFQRSASIENEDERELRFERASITAEQDDGLRGTVEFSGRPPYGGEVRLVDEDGQWRLSHDLSCITPSCDP